MHGKVASSSIGLLRALQALAEESTLLGLKYTHLALRTAIDTCLIESGEPATAAPTQVTAALLH